jgi:hypothetical protein
MDDRAARAALWAWLVTAALLGYWFAWVALSALFHVRSDAGGNLVLFSPGAGSTVYPFTYVAVALAFLGLSYVVIDQERGTRSRFLLGPLVAYVGCVGMINVYEQVYLLGVAGTTHSTYWWVHDWGTLQVAIYSALGLSWVFASAPWWHRPNLPLAVPLIAVFLGSMAVWIGLGFPSVQTGLGWVYVLNATSRLASELVPVALALPPRITAKVYTRLPVLRKRAGPSVDDDPGAPRPVGLLPRRGTSRGARDSRSGPWSAEPARRLLSRRWLGAPRRPQNASASVAAFGSR